MNQPAAHPEYQRREGKTQAAFTLIELLACQAKPRGRSQAQAAFTLIELLVVIAIIAILVAITVPALSNVRESGRVAYCANNLTQLARALVMYIDTNNDSFPSVATAGVMWDTQLLPFLSGATETFRCPSDDLLATSSTNALRTYAANGGIGYHGGLMPFGNYESSPDGPMKRSDCDNRTVTDEKDLASADIILLGERPGTSGNDRGLVGEFNFCGLDQAPGKQHRGEEGGNYLFSSMAVRYAPADEVDVSISGAKRNVWEWPR